jgi:hypothetical protein
MCLIAGSTGLFSDSSLDFRGFAASGHCSAWFQHSFNSLWDQSANQALFCHMIFRQKEKWMNCDHYSCYSILYANHKTTISSCIEHQGFTACQGDPWVATLRFK